MFNTLKKSVACSVLKYIPQDIIIGIGTGSTIKFLIEVLSTIRSSIVGTVSSSIESKKLLKNFNIPVFDLNEVKSVELYIDSADQINHNLEMIKGKGGALTREKILATAAKKFICIADESKYVKSFSVLPVPVEVIPMALKLVIKKISQIGGYCIYRSNFVSDNGNYIIDVYKLNLNNPIKMEKTINNIPGVVSVGLFCLRKADMLLLSTKSGIQNIS